MIDDDDDDDFNYKEKLSFSIIVWFKDRKPKDQDKMRSYFTNQCYIFKLAVIFLANCKSKKENETSMTMWFSIRSPLEVRKRLETAQRREREIW